VFFLANFQEGLTETFGGYLCPVPRIKEKTVFAFQASQAWMIYYYNENVQIDKASETTLSYQITC